MSTRPSPGAGRGALSLPEKQHSQKRLLLLLSARLKPGDSLSRIGDGYLCFVDREVSRWLVVSQDTILTSSKDVLDFDSRGASRVPSERRQDLIDADVVRCCNA